MTEPQDVARQLGEAFATGDLVLLEPLLDSRVRWGAQDETPQTCHSRSDVLAWYGSAQAAGTRAVVTETQVLDDAVVLGLTMTGPGWGPGNGRPARIFQAFRLAGGLIIDIRGYNTREEALAVARTPVPAPGAPQPDHP
ncbi:SnoaL-like protein [Streptomyces sp. 846.5]|nr:nuclear transport factor 2 family protein [Streptomyces sp. 846.5]TDU05120.1 SnoaL-like protein [Streptomyces sp. 846.5]